ncbi:MAG: hypothetical protein HOV87_12200 [Catenulispora sp.]|nr:hypothetical protein [Catenulispora sp.]NUT39991.1 hypothetical protein [Thermoactinospora sp.]
MTDHTGLDVLVVDEPASARQRPEPWFGNLLDWQRDPDTDMRCAWHGGRTRYITKLSRGDADAHKTRPGWHMWDDDRDGWHGIGPLVGTTLRTAYQLAEAWIICPYADMMAYPRLWLAVAGNRVAWELGTIAKDDQQPRFKLTRAGVTVASIEPVFLGRGGAVSVRWRAFDPAGTLLASGTRWAETLAELQTTL